MITKQQTQQGVEWTADRMVVAIEEYGYEEEEAKDVD